MWRTCGVMVLVAGLTAGCSGGGGRAEPRAGKQVVVARFDAAFHASGVAVDGAGTVYTSGWDGKQFVVAAFPKKGKSTRRPIPCATGVGADRYTIGNLAAAPDGTLFWSLRIQDRVVRLDPGGGGRCFAGTGTRGSTGDGRPALDAQVGLVDTLAYDPDRGDLYLDEDQTQAVRKVDPAGVITSVIPPQGISGQGRGSSLAFDRRLGRLYNYESPGIAYRDRDGKRAVIPGTRKYELPFGGMAADPTGGDLVVTRLFNPDRHYCDVFRVSDAGNVRPIPDSTVRGCPEQVAVDRRGDLWLVTDRELVVLRPPR